MVTRDGPGPSGSGETSTAPAASATRSGDQAFTQRLPRHRHVVERDLAPARELLALLVALAGDDDDVALVRDGDRAPDRLAAVEHDLGIRPGARDDLRDDPLGVLGARVVGGDDRQVGELGRDAAHERALAAVAAPARAEDADDSAFGQR